MSVNLLDLFKNQITGEAMKSISGLVGESEEKTGSALSGIAATLMGSLANKASSSDGAASLLSDLGKADTGIMSNITGLLGGDQKDSLLEKGGSLVTSLLGGKSDSILSSITSMAGIGSGSGSMLMKLAGPMLMGFVGKYVKDKALDAIGLGSLLGSQKDHIKAAMPSGLFDKLGFASLGGAAKEMIGKAAGAVTGAASGVTDAATGAARNVTGAANGAAKGITDAASAATGGGGGGFMKTLLIALGLLAVGFFAYKGCSGGDHDGGKHGKVEKHGDKKGDDHKKVDAGIDKLNTDGHGDNANADHDANNQGGSHADGSDSANPDTDGMDAQGLNFEAGSWAYNLNDYLKNGSGSKSFTLDQLDFDSDEVSAAGKTQLDNLAAILKAYPSLTAEIQGHSDKAKNAVGATKKKATTKAKAAWAKLKLTARGVDGKQLSTKGYGDEQLRSDIPEDDNKQKRLVIAFNK